MALRGGSDLHHPTMTTLLARSWEQLAALVCRSNPLTGTLNNPSVVRALLQKAQVAHEVQQPADGNSEQSERCPGTSRSPQYKLVAPNCQRREGPQSPPWEGPRFLRRAIASPCLVAAPIWQSSVFGDRRMVQRHIHAATTNVPVGMALPDAPRAKAGHQGAARRGSRGFPPPPSPVFSHRTPYPSRASIHFLIRPGRPLSLGEAPPMPCPPGRGGSVVGTSRPTLPPGTCGKPGGPHRACSSYCNAICGSWTSTRATATFGRKRT